MQTVATKERARNCVTIGRTLREERIVSRLVPRRGSVTVETLSWADYWKPGQAFFSFDAKLVQRLNRLKATWRQVLAKPPVPLTQLAYCWRYLGLLHHTLRLARQQPRRGDCIPSLQCILGFEAFVLELPGQTGKAAVVPAARNPIYLLGRLAASAALPTTRHVPLVLPRGESSPFYHYRQATLSDSRRTRLLLSPHADLGGRAASFDAIDRFHRLTNPQPDPYYDSRAELLCQRVLLPLSRLWREAGRSQSPPHELSLLDLGGGTGYLAGQVSRRLRNRLPQFPPLSIQVVDSTGPSLGRSYGVTRSIASVASVEWTAADYRELLDNKAWLQGNGPFDFVLICRLLDNISTFSIEPVDQAQAIAEQVGACPLPSEPLLSSRAGKLATKLSLSTTRRPVASGQAMPQFSLNDYFSAMRIAIEGNLDAADPEAWYLPIRRFNPAALSTRAGRSVLGQLMKGARAIVIEDLDLEPADLVAHREKFGLEGTAAVYCTRDGFRTEAHYYVVTCPEWADRLRGERLW